MRCREVLERSERGQRVVLELEFDRESELCEL